MDTIELEDHSLLRTPFYIYSYESLHKSKETKSNIVIGQLLATLASFQNDIDEIISTFDIPQSPRKSFITDSPLSFSYEKVFHLTHDSKLRDKQEFYDQVMRLIGKYKLTNAWVETVLLLLHSSVLLIPYKDDIQVHIPNWLPRVRSPYDLFSQYNPQTEFTIVVNRKMSQATLARTISKDFDVRRGLSRLPEKISTRRESETIIWGYRAWLLKESGEPNMTTFPEIYEYLIEKMGLEDVPEPHHLSVMYQRYLKTRDSYQQ
jgi:hypothetical protein